MDSPENKKPSLKAFEEFLAATPEPKVTAEEIWRDHLEALRWCKEHEGLLKALSERDEEC